MEVMEGEIGSHMQWSLPVPLQTMVSYEQLGITVRHILTPITGHANGTNSSLPSKMEDLLVSWPMYIKMSSLGSY
jgi:hypothetical protein